MDSATIPTITRTTMPTTLYGGTKRLVLVETSNTTTPPRPRLTLQKSIPSTVTNNRETDNDYVAPSKLPATPGTQRSERAIMTPTRPGGTTPSRRALTAMSNTRTSPRPRLTPQKSIPSTVTNSRETGNDCSENEEGIIVAIRVRPLNSKEKGGRRVWKVTPQHGSISQTTNTGQPLPQPDRIIGRTIFIFDNIFGEDCGTAQVYKEVAQGIVASVVTGFNGTIFAYGQTSSGKTHTMQGAGGLLEGGWENGKEGIVQLAVEDIFRSIHNTPDRVFLVRASFIEIYNDEVRDLLDESAVLEIREDPKPGPFVQLVEEVVTDCATLFGVLLRGEKKRAMASTAMNERSSRSHTIVKITVESREKGSDQEGADEGEAENAEEKQNGKNKAVRKSVLNLVDLAGNENEDGTTNQSLLTLSRVIFSLGRPNAADINYHDSKLTRVLQPSLSGDARIAFVCCATPSELSIEATRSTFMFACRASLAKKPRTST